MDASVKPTRCSNSRVWKGKLFSTAELVALHDEYGTHHYKSYPVVMCRGRGVRLQDSDGIWYSDLNATYSAIAAGHANPELRRTIYRQTGRLTSISNIFQNEHAPVLEQKLCSLTGQQKVLFMNSGAEAFDTTVKAVRKWAYRVKCVPTGKAKIIVARGNFHGRTLCAISASSERKYREGFGPFVPGFVKIPFGDIAALERAITPETAAFIIEPIQGEGGINIPPPGYLQAVRKLCTQRNVLLVFDEVQTGLGRTGKLFAYEHWGVKPDLIMLGKALGQYIPISAVLGKAELMELFSPGSHGSTFGGNPLACATALTSIELITRDDCALVRNSADVGEYMREQLSEALRKNPNVLEVRGEGLLIGIALDPKRVSADEVRTNLLRHRVVAGSTSKSSNVLRLSPALIYGRKHVDVDVRRIAQACG